MSEAIEQASPGAYVSPPTTSRLSVSSGANQRGNGSPDGPPHGLQPVPSGLLVADSMMRTVVSNGHDALKILFEAANQDVQPGSQNPSPQEPRGVSHATHTRSLPVAPCTAGFAHSAPVVTNVASSAVEPDHNTDVSEVWNAFRFVRMGWLSAQEAVTLVDL